jgi:NADH:ubiquinone oxidoreductase subunit 5 (subunit L)/multisubunit Na+/H+ antiporter MnhA subunit
MCAGGVIHSMGDSQDIRFTGGISVYKPFTSSCLVVSNFALCCINFSWCDLEFPPSDVSILSFP